MDCVVLSRLGWFRRFLDIGFDTEFDRPSWDVSDRLGLDRGVHNRF